MVTLFKKFGGLRRMADHLSESPSTVSDWKRTGRIPAPKQPGVLRKAEQLDLDVTAEDIIFPLGRPGAPVGEALGDPISADTNASASAAPGNGGEVTDPVQCGVSA